MSRLLFSRLSLIVCVLSLLTLILRLPAWAAPASVPHVMLSSKSGVVTFTPDAGITSLRIQVKTLGGTPLYDSGWVSGSAPLTWQAVDENGAALPAAVYPTHIEARTAGGSTSEDGSLQLVAQNTPPTAIAPREMTSPSAVQPQANPTPTPQVVRGSGTANRLVLWITDKTIGNSILSQSGSTLSMTGTFSATNASGGSALTGTSTSSAPGVLGASQSGAGVRGNATTGFGLRGVATSGIGVRGESTSGAGVTGFSASTAQNVSAIVGTMTSTSAANGSAGVSGINNGTTYLGYGVYGSDAGNGAGVYGTATSGGTGVYGMGTAYGVEGYSVSGYGVYATSVGGTGVYSTGGSYGVYGTGTNYGVYGNSSSGYAGYFDGDVRIIGDLSVEGAVSKPGGSFRIDDPLDPANKYLSHSFVESPDMKNIYDGDVTLNSKGQAVVTMPAYFSALNRGFRYQLTAIGAPGPNLYVARKINGNQWVIAGGKPGMEVSWQVTGVRRDPWANANRIPTEQSKTGAERGRYLYPAGYGKPAGLGIAQLTNVPRPKVAAPQRLAQVAQSHP